MQIQLCRAHDQAISPGWARALSHRSLQLCDVCNLVIYGKIIKYAASGEYFMGHPSHDVIDPVPEGAPDPQLVPVRGPRRPDVT